MNQSSGVAGCKTKTINGHLNSIEVRGTAESGDDVFVDSSLRVILWCTETFFLQSKILIVAALITVKLNRHNVRL